MSSSFYLADEIMGGGAFVAPPHIKYAVIGNPIAKSKTPQVNKALKHLDDDSNDCIRIECSPDGRVFEELLDNLWKREFKGLFIAKPFKVRARNKAKKRDGLAQMCGASNSLLRTEEGWKAFNTDGPAFLASLIAHRIGEVSGLRLGILGANGGVGRAIAAAAMTWGCKEIHLFARTASKGKRLSSKLYNQTFCFNTRLVKHTYEDLTRETFKPITLLVNCTPLGMVDDKSFDFCHLISPDTIVYDVIPHDTPFLKKLASQGNITHNGELMLMLQQIISYDRWAREGEDEESNSEN